MRNRREKASGFDGDRRYLFFVYAPVAEPAAGKGASGIFSVSFDQWISGRGMRWMPFSRYGFGDFRSHHNHNRSSCPASGNGSRREELTAVIQKSSDAWSPAGRRRIFPDYVY